MASDNRDMRVSRDGRVSVLLCFSLLVILINTIFPLQAEERRRGTGNHENSGLQLRFVFPDTLRLINQNKQDHSIISTSIPAQFGPIFFSPIPINSAPKDILMTVKGVGAVLADEIIRYRNHCGRINGHEDLLNLRGVGAKRAKNLRPFFSFTTTP